MMKFPSMENGVFNDINVRKEKSRLTEEEVAARKKQMPLCAVVSLLIPTLGFFLAVRYQVPALKKYRRIITVFAFASVLLWIAGIYCAGMFLGGSL